MQAIEIVGGQLKINAIEIRVLTALLAVEPFHPAVKVRMLAPVVERRGLPRQGRPEVTLCRVICEAEVGSAGRVERLAA
ncbi:hypothetical protein I6F15_29210 [Bradyrhizobium sp. BRP14]|nr:hypothetical protein [Bradyrhizobium sp. BRP14]